ncbi:hypothetical protein TOPH_06115 [Tolypocladium ophioglossoides CBS 100239]|uniref:DUF7136 domain-containing protein n=1 Tax=Tolypocladium ophioglossoides (strain CBS 100239) TaxID=1163406 RepID=A0A0L0N5F1_TOLOC|nr:hypothetical protein TOPH_06115 [Tolypocladium ophioglossoides CBS 100239]
MAYASLSIPLACSRAVDTTTLTLPQTVEVDLIFPRNDTYAPVPLMPVVFAIQNFHVSKPLWLDFYYDISGPPCFYRNTTRAWGSILSLQWANYSSGPDPYFTFDFTSQLNNTEGNWMFSWELHSGNCSMPEEFAPLKVTDLVQRKHIYFTTKNGAQRPDLVTATQDGIRAEIESFAFNITGMIGLNNTEGNWMFSWELHSGNCSMPEEFAPLKVTDLVQRKHIYFITKNGAQRPDLVAATQDGTCADTESVAFNITGMIGVPIGSHYNDQASCPTLSPAAPTPDPCRVKVDSTSASSISYTIQSSACWGGLRPAVTFSLGYDNSAARRAVQFSVGGAAWLAGTLGWLANMA